MRERDCEAAAPALPRAIDTLSNVAEYHVENFGCRASRSDGEAIASALRQRGMEEASHSAAAAVVIVNTCSVTAEADRDARAYLRRVRRQNPQARVIVTGCYAQRAPQELAALPEVNAVVGNSHKSMVADLAEKFAFDHFSYQPPFQGKDAAAGAKRADEVSQTHETRSDLVPLSSLAPAVFVDETFAHTELTALPFAADALQTRPNLKVQDGCGNRCSFCIIPATRGSSRSMPLEDCLVNVGRFVELDGTELVLSGINLGRWGRDLQPARRFEELVRAILETTTLPRLRLSSIEPMDWSPELLALYREFATGAHPRLARHTHLPLQSGSDTVLRWMYRRYRPWHYAERLAHIRELLPEAAIGADVMVGFPGETDALFEESLRFIEAQPFTYLHLFPFSARPGTPGWELHRRNPVPVPAVKERMSALRSLAAEKSRVFRSGLVGQSLSTVTIDSGEGVSDNFVKVTLREPAAANWLIPVRVDGLTAEGVAGSHL